KIFGKDRYNIVAVTHSAGFKNAGEQELADEYAKKMRNLGVKIFTGPMLFHSWNDYYQKTNNSISTTTIIADALRIFGQGTKVAVEITAMAADAGLITLEPVLSIAGTGKGADTIILVKPAYSRSLMEMRVLEVVAKPKK
ncbi:MAG: hypothetical protein ACLFRY_15395, partial [Spirochaetia bacterium]